MATATMNIDRLIGKKIVGTMGVSDPEFNRSDVTLTLDDGSELTIHGADLTLKEPTNCPCCGKELT